MILDVTFMPFMSREHPVTATLLLHYSTARLDHNVIGLR